MRLARTHSKTFERTSAAVRPQVLQCVRASAALAVETRDVIEMEEFCVTPLGPISAPYRLTKTCSGWNKNGGLTVLVRSLKMRALRMKTRVGYLAGKESLLLSVCCKNELWFAPSRLNAKILAIYFRTSCVFA